MCQNYKFYNISFITSLLRIPLESKIRFTSIIKATNKEYNLSIDVEDKILLDVEERVEGNIAKVLETTKEDIEVKEQLR